MSGKYKFGLSGLPSVEQLRTEVQRTRHTSRFRQLLFGTIAVLLVVAAAAVLIAFLLLPVLQIHGTSMAPTLEEGDVVVAVKGAELSPGDLVCFYVGNQLMVERYIAGPGQQVNIEKDGTVYVDDKPLTEPYLKEKALGNCNIKLPYQVPSGNIFCLGDNRGASLDSRNTQVGSIPDQQVVGKVIFRVWPLSAFEIIQ